MSAHRSLCPLNVTREGILDGKSNHQHLFELMSDGGISAMVPQWEIPGHFDVNRVISMERAIVELADRHLEMSSYPAFAAVQLSSTAERISNVNCDGPDCNEALDVWAARMTEEFVSRSLRLLGVAGSSTQLDDSQLARTMIAVTPLLRCHLLFSKAKIAPNEPAANCDVSRVPHMLLGLHIIAAAARSAGMSVITFQTLSKLLQQFDSVLWLLACADCVMAWNPELKVELATPGRKDWQLQYIRIAKRLLPKRQRQCNLTLDEIISEHNIFEGVERIGFLRLLADKLRGRVIPVGEERSKVSWMLRMRRGIGRAVFDAVDDRAPLEYLARQRGSDKQ